jgi:hypothetical protein
MIIGTKGNCIHTGKKREKIGKRKKGEIWEFLNNAAFLFLY